jgi:hypothetical protein
MKTAFAIFCLVAACHAQSIKSCGKDTDIFKNAVFSASPDPISKSAPLTITATGDLQSDVGAGVFHVDLNIKALGIINEPVKLSSPFSIGPEAKAGAQKMVIGPFTLPKVPGTTTVSGTVTGADSSGNEIFCVALDMDVATPPVEPIEPEAKPIVTNCGADTDHLKNISTSATGGVATLTGTLDEAVTAGSVDVDMTVKVSFIKVPIQMNIPFTYSPGVPAGALKLSVGPKQAVQSNINIDVEGTVKISDGSSQEIACVSVTTPSEPRVAVSLIPGFMLDADNSSHYEDPKPNGCLADEQAIQIQGVSGDFCTPQCTGILKTKCPTDVPDGVTAKPQCALKDTSGNKYCALICSPSTDEASLRAGDGACGKATCKAIQGVGLCTYND